MTKGERIKLLREKANMTQEELAKLLNTTARISMNCRYIF